MGVPDSPLWSGMSICCSSSRSSCSARSRTEQESTSTVSFDREYAWRRVISRLTILQPVLCKSDDKSRIVSQRDRNEKRQADSKQFRLHHPQQLEVANGVVRDSRITI